MAISGFIHGLRKPGHLLTGVFPWAGKVGQRLKEPIELLITSPAVAPIWNRILDSRQGQAVLNVIQRFWWRDYSKERVDATPVTPEAAAVLRPTMALSVALTLLAPVALLLPGRVAVVSQVGMELDPAATWSIVLWTGYLWPVWYLLGSTRTFETVEEGNLP